MQNAVFVAHAHRFGGVHHVLHVVLRHFLFRDRHHADFVLAADVFARQRRYTERSGSPPSARPDRWRAVRTSPPTRSFTPPLSMPRDGQLPTPIMLTMPSGRTSPTNAETFAVPISSPTTSFLSVDLIIVVLPVPDSVADYCFADRQAPADRPTPEPTLPKRRTRSADRHS